jgi:hypothetical protein
MKDARAELGNFVFEQFLERKKRSFKRLSAGKSKNGRTSFSRRQRVVLIRKIVNQFKERRTIALRTDLLCFQMRSSKMADCWVKERSKRWSKPIERAKTGIEASVQLRNFSLLDNPLESLLALQRIATLELGARSIRVDFDDKKCQDISAYLVLEMLWKDMTPLFSGGRMNSEIMEVLEAVQIRSRLRMKRASFHSNDEANVRAYPIQQRRPANTSRSLTRMADVQKRERVQDGLVSSINAWLAHPSLDKELTDFGVGSIKNIAGELLDNAERHSEPDSKDGDWSVAGFMMRREKDDGSEYFQCSIGFVSVGKSISESLETSALEVKQVINEYVNLHKEKVPVELLRTIMAIQDGITRDPDAAAAMRGGTGFQEVFDLVHDINELHIDEAPPKVTIISGKACLKMHAPYVKGMRKDSVLTEPREIWFNRDNLKTIPPDNTYATIMPISFPGTLVTMSFTFLPVSKDQT